MPDCFANIRATSPALNSSSNRSKNHFILQNIHIHSRKALQHWFPISVFFNCFCLHMWVHSYITSLWIIWLWSLFLLSGFNDFPLFNFISLYKITLLGFPTLLLLMFHFTPEFYNCWVWNTPYISPQVCCNSTDVIQPLRIPEFWHHVVS